MGAGLLWERDCPGEDKAFRLNRGEGYQSSKVAQAFGGTLDLGQEVRHED